MTVDDPSELKAGELIEFKLGSGWWVWAKFHSVDNRKAVLVELPVEVRVQGGIEVAPAVVRLPLWALLRRLSK